MSITLTGTATLILILTPGLGEDELTLLALAKAEAEALLEEAFETVVEVYEAVLDATLSEELTEELLRVDEALWLPVELPDLAEDVNVAVPVTPLIKKFGEKLTLLVSVSSMISIVYWRVLSFSAEGI